MAKELLWKKINEKMAQCLACRRYCKIKEGEAGFCGVRSNENGELRLLVHSRPCSVWVDPVEKKPLYHFLPGTEIYSIGTFGCNFACSFCQNWDTSQAPQHLRIERKREWKTHFEKLVERCRKLTPEDAVSEALANKCKSIAFTYNEPTIFTEYALDVMKIAKKKGLKGVYVTNGYESHECWDAIAGSIDAVNIDLKAYNEKFYLQLSKVPKWGAIRDSIEYAKKKGIWVEVTTLLIPGWNDNEKELKAAANWLAFVDPEMPWHVTAYHPDYHFKDAPSTPKELLVKAREIGMNAGLKHIYCGNIRNAREYETTYCPKCNKALIVRDGYFIAENNMQEGKCCKCSYKLKGIWK
ncbi:MAG: AmmeMemoRadiSam system radical SAM enzyme [Candidatus Micrarchaeota archaeon]